MKVCFYKMLCLLVPIFVFHAAHCGPARAEIYPDGNSLSRNESVEELSKSLEKIYQKALDQGFKNFIPYSLFLIRQSRHALQKRDVEQATVLAAYACRLSPDLPVAYIAKAKAEWSKNKAFIHIPVTGYIKSLEKTLSGTSIDDLCFFIFSNLAAVTAAFLLTSAVFALIAAIKYFSLLTHDVRHLASRAVPDMVLLGIMLIVFFLPVLLGAAALWLFPYWLIILYTYHTKKEKRAITCLLLGWMILLPLAIGAISLSAALPRSESISALWKTNFTSWSPQDISLLEKLSGSGQEDQDMLISLGLANKKDTNYRTALKYFEKLADSNSRGYQALTNIGNIYLATQKWDEAVAHYQQAISRAPHAAAAAHFNLARAYQQKFMFKEAEQELDEAKKIDRALVDKYLGIYSENFNRMIIDEGLSMPQLWKRGAQDFLSDRQQIQNAWGALFGGIPFEYASAAVFLIFFFNAALSRNEALRVASKCKMCGKSLCRRCQRSITADIMCQQCQNFLKKQDTLGFKLKEDKVAEIKKYLTADKLMTTLLAALLPGAAHIWKGQAARGALCLLIWFTLLLKIVFCLLLPGPWDFIDSMKLMTIAPCIIIMIPFWLVLWANAQRIRTKDLENNILLKTISLNI